MRSEQLHAQMKSASKVRPACVITTLFTLFIFLFLCTIAPYAAGGKPDTDTIRKIIASAAREFPGVLSVAYEDLESSRTVYYNAGVTFPAASIVKVPIFIELYRQFQKGLLSPGDTMKVESRFKVGGSGKVKDMPDGTPVSLKQLGEWMITISDNAATDMLISRIGMKAVNTRLALLGLRNTTLQRTIFDFSAIDRGRDNLTTPADMCSLFAQLYRGRIFAEPRQSEVIGILKRQTRNHLIPKYLPPSVAVAHKTGELSGVTGDCGIIYYPGKPYVLCILAKDITDMDSASRIIASLSGKIYKAVAAK